jgi:tetratricopeptide (TPR) repeat protein
MLLKWAAWVAELVFLLVPMVSSGQAGSANFDDVVSQASAAREQNDVSRAVELYTQAVQLNPKWPDGWWFLGSLQYGAGSYPAARDALAHFIELTPNAGPALALRGLCEFETGEYPQSLEDIQHGIALGAANQPRNEQILRYHEALLLTRLGRFGDALKAYAFFAQKQVTNPELFMAIGLAGLRMPLLPKDVATDQLELFTATGNAAFQFMAGDKSSAGQSFQSLFQRFPAAANAHYLYGYLLFPSDPNAAIAEFKRELDVDPANQAALVMAAWGLLMRNNPSEALPFAQKAAEKEPGLPTPQLVLGRSLAETGNLNAGIEHLEKALQLQPDNVEIHLALAKAYSRVGRKQDAQRERSRSLQMTKDETSQGAQP